MPTSVQYKDGVFYGNLNFNKPHHMNYGAFIIENIRKYKNKIALINGATDEQIKYQEFTQKIVNTASSLSQLGVKIGDVVAICSENSIEYLISTCAALCVGATVTFYNTSYSEHEINHALNISKPKYIFLSSAAHDIHYENLQKQSVIRKYILYDGDKQGSQYLSFRDLLNVHVDIDTYRPVNFEGEIRTCVILYSSGTTGLAKGAKLSNLNCIVANQQPPQSDCNLSLLTVAPWSSTMGLLTVLQGIFHGRKTVFLSRYSEKLYLQTIEKYKTGFLLVAPPLLTMLCKSKIANDHDLSSVKVISSGGATTRIEVINQIKARYPQIKCVIQGYGMTEATGALTLDYDTSPKEGSVGKVAPGLILKVIDPDTDKVLGCREPGEVCIKGPVLFQGYMGLDSDKSWYSNGFYKTGDIGYYDEEGYFYIIDRIKEMIKYNAWQVSPSELEALLVKHKNIIDAAVFGIPDMTAGELPTAVIVKEPKSQITENEIIEYIDKKVAPWKKLRGGVIFTDEIPKNPSGKILRRKLKELALKLVSKETKVTSKL